MRRSIANYLLHKLPKGFDMEINKSKWFNIRDVFELSGKDFNTLWKKNGTGNLIKVLNDNLIHDNYHYNNNIPIQNKFQFKQGLNVDVNKNGGPISGSGLDFGSENYIDAYTEDLKQPKYYANVTVPDNSRVWINNYIYEQQCPSESWEIPIFRASEIILGDMIPLDLDILWRNCCDKTIPIRIELEQNMFSEYFRNYLETANTNQLTKIFGIMVNHAISHNGSLIALIKMLNDVDIKSINYYDYFQNTTDENNRAFMSHVGIASKYHPIMIKLATHMLHTLKYYKDDDFSDYVDIFCMFNKEISREKMLNYIKSWY